MTSIKTTMAIIAVAIIALVGCFYPQSTNTIRETVEKTVAGTTSYDSVTEGSGPCATLTDANGGTYTLTDTELANNSCFKFAAGGTGQAVIALTFPATSTMRDTIPQAGDCRSWYYDATALSAATTTTMTAGTGHDIIAYTVNDDVIDGNELSQWRMCRQSNGNVFTFVSELLQAD